MLVTQRAGPVAEGYATIHAAGGLRTAVAAVQGLFYLAETIYTFVDGTIARLLSPTPSTTAIAPEFRTQKRSPTRPLI